MRTKSVYFSKSNDGSIYLTCEVEVPGLGVVKLNNCLSLETIDKVCREAEAAMRLRLEEGFGPKEPVKGLSS